MDGRGHGEGGGGQCACVEFEFILLKEHLPNHKQNS